jgi:large subunit ribosomal protein L13
MKTYLAKRIEDKDRKWHVVDASGKVLGRLSVQIANVLRGRHRPTYTPNADTGDYVVVINADKVVLTGKKEEGKDYMFFSGWVGTEKHRSARQMREHRPEFLVMHAVKGMLPKNRLASRQLTRLKVYAGATHPHAAQNPEPLSK